MDDTELLKAEIAAIKDRNRRVEADKAWETSFSRKVFIALLTYFVVTLALFVIHNSAPFINALIPTLGFLLSVQSIPAIKKAWIRKYLETQELHS